MMHITNVEEVDQPHARVHKDRLQSRFHSSRVLVKSTMATVIRNIILTVESLLGILQKYVF